MYNIEMPNIINQISGAFYGLGMWNSKDGISYRAVGLKLFHLLYFVSFLTAVSGGAVLTDNIDDFVLSTAIFLIAAIQFFRLNLLLLKQNEIQKLINQIGTHSTDELMIFTQVNNKIMKFEKIVQVLLSVLIVEFFLMLVCPLLTSEKLLFNSALLWENSRTAFWMAHIHLVLGSGYAIVCIFLSVIICYLLMNLAIEYEILGYRVKSMGVIEKDSTKLKSSNIGQKRIFLKELIATIEHHQKVNNIIELFSSTFSYLFFIQVLTSSMSICGLVYTLAFSSHNNIPQDLFYCIVLVYNYVDILVVMYFGNEIRLYSDRLTYCLFESHWIEQTQSYKKYMIIMSEVLKRPQEITVGKVYRLNLKTFTSIVNGAYSLYNILQNIKI